MLQYKVRSGQNIYDVALTLYGSVEGVFDLLASNDWLNMETVLSYGMTLNYHEEFVINKDIVLWLQNNNILVKNGEHIYDYLDIEEFIKEHIRIYHTDFYNSLLLMSPDEQNMYWENLYTPRMVIHQQGQTSAITMRLKTDNHFVIDWGDYSAPQIVETTEETEIEHCYKGLGSHVITLYGDFEFSMLDLRNVNGVYYPLGTIYADQFESALDNEDLNTLIITQ